MNDLKDMPRHGTKSRYRRIKCRCVGCTRHSSETKPTQLMWPFSHLERAIGSKRVAAFYKQDLIDNWRANGLDDYEADRVAIHLGTMAHMVWPGWTIAGLDAEVYP